MISVHRDPRGGSGAFLGLLLMALITNALILAGVSI
jgi:hypothetical protein